MKTRVLAYTEPFRESRRIEQKVLLLMDRGYKRALRNLDPREPGAECKARMRNAHAANARSAFRLYDGGKGARVECHG